MNHSISKEELRRPDQITAAGQRIFAKMLGQQKMILGAVVGLLLLGAGIVAWDQGRTKKELSIQEQYYEVERAYLKKKEAFDKAELQTKDPAKKGETTGLPTGDFNKDYGTEVQGWLQLIESHPSSKSAAMAALELSQLYLKYNKNNEALQVLSKVKAHQNSDGLLGALVFQSYATELANQGQCQDSLNIWDHLEKKKKMAFLSEQAQMGKALCLETLGQVEKAEIVLKDLVAGKGLSEKQVQPKPKSQIQRTAENYLRYLKVKKNLNTAKAS